MENNRRATAIIFSAMMIGLKLGLTIGSSLVTWILGLYNYIPKKFAASEMVTQPESAIEGTKLLVSIYPAIAFFLAIALLFFYEINKKMETQIEDDLITRRKA